MSKTRARRYYSGFKKSKWWREKRRRLYFERGGVCEACGLKFPLEDLELHHVVPRSNGGRDVDGNLRLLCGECHEGRHAG
jgi:5-methylcytosine-specific restriction endonuclease McrA